MSRPLSAIKAAFIAPDSRRLKADVQLIRAAVAGGILSFPASRT